MKIVRTDRMVCKSRSTFLFCWWTIAAWMGACVANACFSFSLVSQSELDGLGFFVLCAGMTLMFMTFKFRLETENRWESMRFRQIASLTMGSHPRLERFIGNAVFFLVYVVGPAILIYSLLSNPDVSLPTNYFWLTVNVVMVWLVGVVLSLILFTGIIAVPMIVWFFFRAIWWTMVMHSGRMRRIGIWLLLMAATLLAFLSKGCAEWQINMMVMISLSLFLYDIRRMAVFADGPDDFWKELLADEDDE